MKRERALSSVAVRHPIVCSDFGMPESGSPMRIGVGGRLDGALSTRKEARAPRLSRVPLFGDPSHSRVCVCVCV